MKNTIGELCKHEDLFSTPRTDVGNLWLVVMGTPVILGLGVENTRFWALVD